MILGLAWATLVWLNAWRAQPQDGHLIASYFWPATGSFSLEGFARAQLHHATALAAVGLYDLLAWSVGRDLLRWLRAGRLRGVTGAGAAFLLGGGAAGLAAFGAASCGLAYPGLVAAAAVAGVVRMLAPGRRTNPVTVARGVWRGLTTTVVAAPPGLRLLAGVTAVGALAGALAPEVILDATRSFLEVPRRLDLLHRLVPQEGSPLAFTPLFPHLVAWPLFALGGETPVRLLSWQAGLLVAALVREWLAEDRKAAPFAPYAAVAWLTLLNVPMLSQTAMPDLVVAAWVTFAARLQFGMRRSLAAGALWGGAVGIKYQVGAVFLACVAGGSWSGGAALRLVLPALAVAAAWPLRNWLGAGWLLYPLAVPAAVAASVHSPLPFFFMPLRWAAARTAGTVLAAAWTRTTTPAYWDGLFSPLLLVLLPFAFTRATRPGVRVGLAGAIAAWAWTFGSIGRYLTPVAPLLLLEGCRGLSRRWTPPRRGPVRLLLLLPLAWEAATSFGWAARLGHPLAVTLGRESRAAYVGDLLRPAPATGEMGEKLAAVFAPTTRFYLAGQLRAWSWPGLAVFDAEFVPSNLSRWAEGAASPSRLRIAFRERGLAWLVVYEPGAGTLGELAPGPGGWTPRSRGVTRTFLARYGERRDHAGSATGGYTLWSLSPRPHPDRPVRIPVSILPE